MMAEKVFGSAGNRVVIEEFLTGREMTVLAFTDGKTVCPMMCSQDHKRAFDGDLGLNTGGMGAFAPSPVYTAEIARYCETFIYQPTIDALQQEGILFKGVLYFGLMLTENGVKVIEYNARFGDPETQVVLPLLKTDLMDILDAVIDEKLDSIDIEWENKYSACIVAASGGYPEAYQKGYEISISPLKNNSMIFHAGTMREGGKYLTSGGRVLGVTAIAESLKEAVALAYDDMNAIRFRDMHYRKDIGIKE